MISSENLVPVSIVLTERKLQFCKIVQDSLKKEGINKTEDDIVKAINQIKSEYFLTQNELNTKKISGNSFPAQEILEIHPYILEIIYQKLFN